MKLISILLVLVAVFFGIVLTAVGCYGAYLAWTRGLTRDFVASSLVGIGAVLAFRCAVWFGSLPTVLRDRRKMADVAAFAALIVSVPIAAVLESRSEGALKAGIQLSVVFVTLAAYFAVRARYRVSSQRA